MQKYSSSGKAIMSI